MSTRLDELEAKLVSDRKFAEITASFNGIHLHSVFPGISREERAEAVRLARRLVAEWEEAERSDAAEAEPGAPANGEPERLVARPADGRIRPESRYARPAEVEPKSPPPPPTGTPEPISDDDTTVPMDGPDAVVTAPESSTEPAETAKPVTAAAPEPAESAKPVTAAAPEPAESAKPVTAAAPEPAATPVASQVERRKTPRTPIEGAERIEEASRLAEDDSTRREPTIRTLENLEADAAVPNLRTAPRGAPPSRPDAPPLLPEEENSGTRSGFAAVLMVVALIAVGGYLFRDEIGGILGLGEQPEAVEPAPSPAQSDSQAAETAVLESPADGNAREAQSAETPLSTEPEEDSQEAESEPPTEPGEQSAADSTVDDAIEPVDAGPDSAERPEPEPTAVAIPEPAGDQVTSGETGAQAAGEPAPEVTADPADTSSPRADAAEEAPVEPQPEEIAAATSAAAAASEESVANDEAPDTSATISAEAPAAADERPESAAESSSAASLDAGSDPAEQESQESPPTSGESTTAGEAEQVAPEPVETMASEPEPSEAPSDPSATPTNDTASQSASAEGEAVAMIVVEQTPDDATDATAADSALLSQPPAEPDPAQNPLYDAEIYTAQEHLSRLGYSPGPADGVLGPRTRRAIRAFQRDIGVIPDARVTPSLLAAMESAP